jgi:hypothetical protein
MRYISRKQLRRPSDSPVHAQKTSINHRTTKKVNGGTYVKLAVSVTDTAGFKVSGSVQAVVDGNGLSVPVKNGTTTLTGTLTGTGTVNVQLNYLPNTAQLAPSSTTVAIQLK